MGWMPAGMLLGGGQKIWPNNEGAAQDARRLAALEAVALAALCMLRG